MSVVQIPYLDMYWKTEVSHSFHDGSMKIYKTSSQLQMSSRLHWLVGLVGICWFAKKATRGPMAVSSLRDLAMKINALPKGTSALTWFRTRDLLDTRPLLYH